MQNELAAHLAAIYNTAWQVRFWCRPAQRARRAQAVRALGLAVRRAFNLFDDFEPLLFAVADALRDAAPPSH
jgi:hypothetical protein